jgi:DNA gyrase/topoisomerase IV subunit A
MKKIIDECSIKRGDWEYAKSQHEQLGTQLLQLERDKNMEILQLQKKLQESQQEITGLKISLQKAVDLAQSSITELKNVRAQYDNGKK